MTVSSESKAVDGSRIVQYVAGLTANLGIVCSEMHFGWPSPFIPILLSGQYYFTLTSEEASYLTVVPLMGAMVGAVITGIFVDNCGRQKLITYASIPSIASWLLVGVARSPVLMFIGRFLAGITDGIAFVVVPMYLGEIADATTRGLLSCMCPVSGVLGLLLINILGTLLRLETVAYLSACLPILLLMFFSYMPESPYFHLMKNDTDGARISLQTLRGRRDVSEELERISEAVREQNENKGTLSDLITVKSNRKALVVALGVRGFQQLCGISAIVFYCQTIFGESKSVISPSTATIIYFSVQLVISTLFSFAVDCSGRRPLLIISIAGTTVTLLSNGIYLYLKSCTNVDVDGLDFIPILSLLGYIILFSVGLNTIPLIMMGELFPTNVKAFALCLMDFYDNMIVTFTSKFFHWSKDEFGMYVPFFVFTVLSFIGLLFFIFLVPETKGKTLEDIQKELCGEKKSESKSLQ